MEATALSAPKCAGPVARERAADLAHRRVQSELTCET